MVSLVAQPAMPLAIFFVAPSIKMCVQLLSFLPGVVVECLICGRLFLRRWFAGFLGRAVLLAIHHPSPAKKNEMLIFGLCWTSDDQLGWLMDLNPICHPSPAKKWNAHFWITFNFWWSARLVDGLEPHAPPLSSQKNEMLIFGLHSTSDDQPGCLMDSNPILHLSPAKKWNAHFWITFNFWCQPGWSMDSNPIHHPSPAKKIKCSFLDGIQLLMLARLVNGLEPHLPPLSSQKNEMLIFGLYSTSDVGQAGQWSRTPSATPLQPKEWNAHFWIIFNFYCWPGWLMELNPICHPSPAKNIKCSFLDYVHFWWSNGLVDRLKPHPPPLSNQKNEMLGFGLPRLSSQKMKCSVWDYVQLLMIGWDGGWTQTPSTTSFQPKKNEMLIFGLCSTSDDWLGWSMDSNPICKPSRAKRMKCSYLDYIQLLMIGWAGQWAQTPSATSLQPKNEMLSLGLRSTSDYRLDWWMDSNPIQNPSSAIKLKYSFLDYAHFWWSAGLVDGIEPHLPPPAAKKNEMLIFGLCSTSDDWLGWSMDWNPICHPSPAKKVKCSFLDCIQLLMISWAGQWNQTPSATPLQPKKLNAHFWITFNFYCWPGWSMDSNPICHPSPAKKMKCSFLDCIQLLMISWAGQWTQTPSATSLQPNKNEMLIFGLRSTSDDRLGWSMDSNPICHPSRAKRMKCSYLDYVQLLMISWAGQWTQTPSVAHLQPKNEILIFGLRSTSDDWLGWSMDSNPIQNPSPAK